MITRSIPPVARAVRPTPPPPAPSRKPEPCAMCGHEPGSPLPPGRILRDARIKNRPGLTVDQFLELAECSKSLSWYSALENHRKTVPRDWSEWTRLCKAAGIDPAKAAAGASAPWTEKP